MTAVQRTGSLLVEEVAPRAGVVRDLQLRLVSFGRLHLGGKAELFQGGGAVARQTLWQGSFLAGLTSEGV